MDMRPGRELDAAIHERLYGPWDESRCRVCGWPIEDPHCMPGNCSMRPAPSRRADEPPPYSTNGAVAFGLLDRMRETSMMVSLSWGRETGWWCVVYPPEGSCFETDGVDSAPLAICLAAMLAIVPKSTPAVAESIR